MSWRVFFWSPREMCDIYGGTGLDVLEGNAKVLTETGKDWTDGMIMASEKNVGNCQKRKYWISSNDGC